MTGYHPWDTFCLMDEKAEGRLLVGRNKYTKKNIQKRLTAYGMCDIVQKTKIIRLFCQGEERNVVHYID